MNQIHIQSPKLNGNHQQGDTQYIVSKSPANGEVNGRVPITAPSEAPAILATARQAQQRWASLAIDERLRILKNIHDEIYYRHDEFVDLLTKETGRIPHEARFEILQPLVTLQYLIANAKKILKPRRQLVPQLPHRRHKVVYQPHGVVLIITPWNFPFLLATDPMMPALVAGNAVIYKPSEQTPLLGQLLAETVWNAGVPKDVLQIAHGYAETGSGLIDAKPNHIHFTGSTKVGRLIAEKAGQLLIPVSLELGGNDAAIVLKDANIQRTARGIAWGSMVHGGQMCLGVERVYVDESIKAEFIKELRQTIRKNVQAGTPDSNNATYGPLTLDAQVEQITHQIVDAKQQGSTVYEDVETNEKLKTLTGHFMQPVLVTDLADDTQLMTEESFGPVMVVNGVQDEYEAIRRTNASNYGLTASIWTENRKRAEHIAEQLHVGMVSVNEHIVSAATPQLPWGGVKNSGFGRTRGPEGLRGMTTTKVISNERFRLPIEPFWYPYTKLKKAFVKRLIHLWTGPTLKDRLKGFSFRGE